MGKIWELLTDPAWWFTAIVIGLFVSIIAGLLTTRISAFLSAFFSRYRVRRQRRQYALLRDLCWLSKDPHLMKMYQFDIVLYAIMATVLLLLIFSNPAPNKLIGVRLIDRETGDVIGDALRLACFPVLYYFGYLIGRRYERLHVALRFYIRGSVSAWKKRERWQRRKLRQALITRRP